MSAFLKPERKIKSPMDLSTWLKSNAYQEYVRFISALSVSVNGKSTSVASEDNRTISILLDNLNSLSRLCDEIEPIEQPQRFGNAAYRTWFDKMSAEAENKCATLVAESSKGAAIELASYWIDSFGNKSRIDYGTGHEMNFMIFLLCLSKLRVFVNQNDDGTSSDCNLSLVNLVFAQYMDVVRKVQMRYCMEPAGSHGVYSLDDYQFLPFYFGASQLAGSTLEPKDIPDAELMSNNKDSYLFCAAIDHINKVKTGPFSEHSNQLWNISAVPHWKKVNQGLMKMYQAEVLSKFPIVQHLLFGSIFKFE